LGDKISIIVSQWLAFSGEDYQEGIQWQSKIEANDQMSSKQLDLTAVRPFYMSITV